MLIDLMDLDHKKTIELLLEKNTISSDKIVEKLGQNELHLYRVNKNERLEIKFQKLFPLNWFYGHFLMWAVIFNMIGQFLMWLITFKSFLNLKILFPLVVA